MEAMAPMLRRSAHDMSRLAQRNPSFRREATQQANAQVTTLANPWAKRRLWIHNLYAAAAAVTALLSADLDFGYDLRLRLSTLRRALVLT
jgi:hypothetical protein